MSMATRVSSLLRNLLHRDEVERDLDAEMRSAIDILADEKIRDGLPATDARRQARLELGGITQVKEQVREASAGQFLHTVGQDVRYALRLMRRSPGFTIVSVVTLALAIGANVAIFSVINAVLLRPLPYRNPERLVDIWQGGVPRGLIYTLAERSRTMDIAGYVTGSGVNLTGNGAAVRVPAGHVTANFFSLLGTPAFRGRTFDSGEDAPGKSHVVVLSYSAWQKRFAADENILGRTLNLNEMDYQVIGVMPRDFRYFDVDSELWLPLENDPKTLWAAFFQFMIGRVRDGYTVADARTELNALKPGIIKAMPWPMGGWGWWADVIPLQESLVGNLRRKLLIATIAVAVVLLIAAANVANLLLARMSVREKEVAVRVAMGAGRARIVRQFLTETLLLSFFGALLGVLLAREGISLFTAILPADRVQHVSLDLRVLGFALALTLLTGLLFGIIPAWRSSKLDPEQALRGNTPGSGISRRQGKLSAMLVVTETALATVLVISAGLLVRSLWQLVHLDTGFTADGVVTARINPPTAFCADLKRCYSFYDQLQQEVAAYPGVKSVAVSAHVPFAGYYSTVLAVEGNHEFTAEHPIETWLYQASPWLLDVLSVPLLKGRKFTAADDDKAPGVALVSAKFAARVWPGQNPIGKRVQPSWMQNSWRTVVGVVADTAAYGVSPGKWADETTGAIYFPHTQGAAAPMTQLALMAKSERPLDVAAALPSLIARQQGNVSVSDVRTLHDVIAQTRAVPRSTTMLFASLALLGMLLGAIGIYGVVSYSVSSRTHEIGVRMALGAEIGTILAMVLKRGVAWAGAGVLIGMAGGLTVTRIMTNLLYGVKPSDPATFVSVAALLVCVALLASLLPARRAARVDPAIALRYE